MTALVAPYTLEYPYVRATGPVIGRFLTGLRDGRVEGVRTQSGRVLVPAIEYDPETGDSLGARDEDWVAVASCGVVTTWTWVAEPRPAHPLDRPFAWILVRLDGADTALLHALDVGAAPGDGPPPQLQTGLRVRIRWATERVGSILDIACFVPEDAPADPEVEVADRVASDGAAADDDAPPPKPVTRITSPVRLEYRVAAADPLARFLRALLDKRILGERCPSCEGVYVPPRGSCPRCAVPTVDPREIAQTGTVTTFCVVNFPFPGQKLTPPYVCACIVLDGADLPIFHMVGGLPAHAVRMGLRVRAEWVDDADLAPTMESIRWFVPTGEPDADYATYREHL